MGEGEKLFVKIRGIYTTALTKLLFNCGYTIVQPSSQIQERFRLPDLKISEDIFIRDLPDHQGVLISGNSKYIKPLISLFKVHFFDLVMRPGLKRIWSEDLILNSLPRLEESEKPVEEKNEEIELEVEFPAASKAALDALRATVTPTIKKHHLLKIIASEWVELGEKELGQSPHVQTELEKKIWEQIVIKPLKKRGVVGLTHVSPEGKIFFLREGEIISLENNCLVIKRKFVSQGCYDGLNLPIEEGDYGVTEITEYEWYLKHAYYSGQDALKGIYWNINTPVEFYPDHIRYLDLHIDVVQKSGDLPKIIDQEKLEKSVALGLITSDLAKKAQEQAFRFTV